MAETFPSYAIDPELAPLLRALPDRESSDDFVQLRLETRQIVAQMPQPDLAGITVTDLALPRPHSGPDIPVRIYTPDDPAGPVGILFVHGGGFTTGDLDTEHVAAVPLCRDLGAVVVSVDYRLAPENPYPAGLEDCYAALSWFAGHAVEYGVDPARIAVRGGSAGGGLCAALCLLARDRGGPTIAFQYLGIPELDDRLATTSAREFVDTPIFNRSLAEQSWDAYLGPGVRGTLDVPVYAAPARATALTGLPPAYISAMAYDPLRDEGIQYAQALLAAGVPVELHVFPGTFHGSAMVTTAQVTQRERADGMAAMRYALGLPPVG
jgi:acetyl esterase